MTPLLMLVIKELPTIISLVRQTFADKHPDAPEPTDAEIIAAFDAAYQRSLAIDQAWLDQHQPPR